MGIDAKKAMNHSHDLRFNALKQSKRRAGLQSYSTRDGRADSLKIVKSHRSSFEGI
jgi:hypothetical protein